MLRKVSSFIALSCFLTVAAFAATKEEKHLAKTEESLKQATAMVTTFRDMSGDADFLKKSWSDIEKVWEDFQTYQGHDHPLEYELALIRARSLTAADKKHKMLSAWKSALMIMPKDISPAEEVSLYLEAASAAVLAEKLDQAEQYFSSARSLAAMTEENADKAKLYMRLHELKLTGASMEWRPLRDALLDLREFAEHFTMWSVPRLDALLGEAEIRLELQPDNVEKRKDLSIIKAKIVLMEKSMKGMLPPQQMARVRSLYYALEDKMKL